MKGGNRELSVPVKMSSHHNFRKIDHAIRVRPGGCDNVQIFILY